MIEVRKLKVAWVTHEDVHVKGAFAEIPALSSRGSGWLAAKYAVSCHTMCGALFIVQVEWRCVFAQRFLFQPTYYNKGEKKND